MPNETRIAALFRNNELFHPTGSTLACRKATYSAIGLELICQRWANCLASRRGFVRSAFLWRFYPLEANAKFADVALIYGLEEGTEYRCKQCKPSGEIIMLANAGRCAGRRRSGGVWRHDLTVAEKKHNVVRKIVRAEDEAAE